MNLRNLEAQYLPEKNVHYAKLYPLIFITLIVFFVLLLVGAFITSYLLHHKPKPVFLAVQKTGEQRTIYATNEPNLLSTTIIRFATQALVRSYNFAPIGNEATLRTARSYFTESGWAHYLNSVLPVIKQVENNKLFGYGIVSGTPLVAQQGELPDTGYTWRVQIPFLVTFMSAEDKTQHNYIVTVTIVRVPTYVHPQGIGIDQFIMVNPSATI